MVTNLKALVIVLVLAGLMFHAVKPYAVRFMAMDDFVRRRNLWLLLTVAAFASPSFWIFAPIAFLLCAKAGRRDPNPAALFLLAISAVPPVTLPIPTVGIGALFDLNLPRILALAVLLPVAMLQWGKPRESAQSGALRLIDACVVGFIALQLLVLLPYDSVTNILRRGLHFVLDFGLVYYVMSRTLTRQASVYEALAAFVLSCAVLAPLSLFETTRNWLLYQGLGELWGRPDPFAWLFRGDALRAQTTVGHSLTFGFHMAIGFGLMLALARTQARGRLAWIGGLLMWVGLISAWARAPWLAAAMFAVVVAALAPGGTANLKRLMLWAVVGGGALLMSPWGDAVLDLLPFVGTVDSANVAYREQLAQTSWNLILRNPLLGDPLVLRDMESLRQGQGIIDIVNSYAAVALFNGLIGLALFVAPMLIASFLAYRVSQARRTTAPSDTLLGAALLGAMLATLFYIATCGFGWLLYALLGLLTAYVGLDRRELALITPTQFTTPAATSPIRPTRPPPAALPLRRPGPRRAQ